MILRIGDGHIKPGTWDDYEKVYRRLVEVEQPRGLHERWLLRDRDDENRGFSVSLWDSDEAVSGWVGSDVFAQISDEMRPFFVGDYRVHNCEVRLHEQLDGS